MPTHESKDNISIAIITYNEAGNIGNCIQSAKMLGPIIVVDSGSKDGTIEIVSSSEAKLFAHPWVNFSIQKQYAVDNCATDWVLVLDADERITPQLIEEINNLVLDDPAIAYVIPRRSFFLNTEVKHCGWTPDYVLRLFNRDQCRFNGRAVHEAVIGFKKIKHLKNPLIHYSYQSAADVEKKTILYSDLGSRDLSAKRTKIPSVEPALRASWAFLKTFIIKLGILDGMTGFKISKMNYKCTYLKYKKARDLLDLAEQSRKG